MMEILDIARSHLDSRHVPIHPHFQPRRQSWCLHSHLATGYFREFVSVLDDLAAVSSTSSRGSCLTAPQLAPTRAEQVASWQQFSDLNSAISSANLVLAPWPKMSADLLLVWHLPQDNLAQSATFQFLKI
jgi:hypothetical protein